MNDETQHRGIYRRWVQMMTGKAGAAAAAARWRAKHRQWPSIRVPSPPSVPAWMNETRDRSRKFSMILGPDVATPMHPRCRCRRPASLISGISTMPAGLATQTDPDEPVFFRNVHNCRAALAHRQRVAQITPTRASRHGNVLAEQAVEDVLSPATELSSPAS